MSGIPADELRSVEQISITNESEDTGVTHKEVKDDKIDSLHVAISKPEENVQEKSLVTEEDSVETKIDAKSPATHPPVDTHIENLQNIDSSHTFEARVDAENTNVDKDKENNASSAEQASATTTEILDLKPPVSKDNYIVSGKTKKEGNNDITKDEHAEHVTYSDDGTAIYTDPKTNYQYKWSTKENSWIPNDAASSTNPYENEHYKWCTKTEKWIPKQTQVTETEHYKWDAEKNEWVAKVKKPAKTDQANFEEIVYDVDEDGQRIYTDKDGTVFFWDVQKNAWFPKIDDDFMARYQMSYGFIDNTSESEREKEKREMEAAMQKEKELAEMVEEAKANEEASKDTGNQGLKRKQPQEPPSKFEELCVCVLKN